MLDLQDDDYSVDYLTQNNEEERTISKRQPVSTTSQLEAPDVTDDENDDHEDDCLMALASPKVVQSADQTMWQE